MIRFITTSGFPDTVESAVKRRMGADMPDCTSTTYEKLFRATTTLNAVHVFTDIERLSDAELARAAQLYRALRDAGLTCLNDPARVMARYQLLTALKQAGINPFSAYPADGLPKPDRFPVFVRGGGDHNGAISDLLHDQAQLDGYLQELRQGGRPLRGLLVIEYAAEPVAPGFWRRYSTYRVGAKFYVHGASVARHWVVKRMDEGPGHRYFEEELEIVTANRHEESVVRAFDLAGIEWGRADHGIYEGRHVIYEINTNPQIEMRQKQSPVRELSRRVCTAHMAALLREIDKGDGSNVTFHLRGTPKPWYRKLRRRLGPRLGAQR